MNYEVIPLTYFEKALRRLVKKYPSLKAEMARLVADLEANPKMGTPLGRNAYKIRIAIKSK